MNTVKVSVTRLVQNVYPFMGKIVFDLIGDRNLIPVQGIFCNGTAVVSLVPNEQILSSSYYQYRIYAQGHMPGTYLSEPVEEGNCIIPAYDCNLDSLISDIPDQTSAEQIIADASTKVATIQEILNQIEVYASQVKNAAKSTNEAYQKITSLVHQAELLRHEIHAGHIPVKVSDLENDAGYLTQHQSLEEYAKKIELPVKVSELTNDTGYLTSLSWTELQDKPITFTPTEHLHNVSNIIDFPVNVSEFINDAHYLTEHQDLSDYIKSIDVLPHLVPTPTIADQNKYLKGNGTWDIPENTTYNNATDSVAGLMSSADKSKLDSISIFQGATSSSSGSSGLIPAPSSLQKDLFLKGDGTWSELPIQTVIGDNTTTILVSNAFIDTSSEAFANLTDNSLIFEIED